MQVIDFVVADARVDSPRDLRIADVIWLSGDCACPRCWVGDALVRWPGSLVVAARAGEHGCVAGARGQGQVLFVARPGTAWCPVLECASFAYWWVGSGWSLASLAVDGVIPVSVGVA